MDIEINKSKVLKALSFLYKDENEKAFEILLSMLDTQEQKNEYLTKFFPANLTEEDKITISYCRMGGYNWVAQDSNGHTYAFKEKPYYVTRNGEQRYWLAPDDSEWKSIKYPLSFISPEALEPFYIGF